MIRYAEEYRKHFEKSDEQALYQQERLLFDATELLSRAMKDEHITKAELARRIRKSKAYVTQVLRGRHNMTLRTLAELTWALGYSVELGAVNPSTSHEIYLRTWTSQIASRAMFRNSPLQAAVLALAPHFGCESERDECREKAA